MKIKNKQGEVIFEGDDLRGANLSGAKIMLGNREIIL